METPESSERKVGPTVSREKWRNHAKAKLQRGYVLVLGRQRRNANFYLPSKGFEMCPLHVAKALIREGIVVEDGQHHLGTRYKLAAPLQAEAALPKEKKPAPPPDEEPLLEDELDLDEGTDEAMFDEETP